MSDTPERIWAYTMLQSQVVAARSPIHFPQWAETHQYFREDVVERIITEAVSLADGKDEAGFIEGRLRAVLEKPE